MDVRITLLGLGFTFGGAVVVAVADAWLSRSLLIYLDAVEANVGRVVALLRDGGAGLAVTGIDLKRDRGQDRARALKVVGWVVLILGLGLQLAAAWAGRPAV